MYFDVAKKKWTCIHEEDINIDKIEKMPVMIVMEYDGMLLWWDIPKRQWRIVAKYEGMNLYTTDGQHVQGMPVLLEGEAEKTSLEAAKFWRFYYDEAKDYVFVAMGGVVIDIARNDDEPYVRVMHICRNKYGNCTYDMKTGECWKLSAYDDVSMPREVLLAVSGLLQDAAEKNYGVRPMISEYDLARDDFLEAFMFRPFDLNGYQLIRYFGTDIYYVPRDCKDIYTFLCNYLSISPPAKLRELYGVQPSILPWYKILCDLGFQDFSCMEKMFSVGRIGPYKFASFYDLPILALSGRTEDEIRKNENIDDDEIDHDDDTISQAEIDALLNGAYLCNEKVEVHYGDAKWKRLKVLISWMIRERGEEMTTQHLLNFSDTESLRNKDLWRLINERIDDSVKLPLEVGPLLLDHGFTREVYEKLVDYIVREGFDKRVNS